jgi:DNA-binding MarR family transcriptional regulator
MEAHYQTLKTIYDIAGNDPQPETYGCRPREMILRLFVDWSVIHQHLKILEQEGLITTAQLNTLIVRIRLEGIEKLRELKHERASA